MLESDVSQLRRAWSEARAEEDPFERFNRAQGVGSVRDPYAGIAAMRAQAPVHRVDLRAFPRGGNPMTAPPDEIYTVLSYEGVFQVLRDGKRFSSAGYERSMGVVFGHTILAMDGEEHLRYRALISRAFTRRALERWERDLVRPAVQAYVDRFAGRGSADLVRELTFPFPVRVIAAMIGLPEEEHARFHRLAVELISIGIDWEAGIRASRELGELFAPVLAARRREPRDDLMSVLAHAELDGTRLSDEDIYAFLRLLAPAGAETTYRSSSNLLFGLLCHPEQLDAVRRGRALIPQAIEEGLRWECPLLSIMRTATGDTEVEGVPIPAGAAVSVHLGAANRDPARWTDPDRFDVFRLPKPHIAFALGPHVCLGMHLARMETRVALETLFDRLPGLRLDPAADDVHISGLVFRSPQALPVVFDVAGAAR
ncbi:MAG TPA: cytochrome P450 [Myxococcota bacterium]|nr:cytochrome P450 [Myxococcota bacterium]